ncbi:MAG: class I SAM-dependent methyltransferase [Rhodospirillales bacterium]
MNLYDRYVLPRLLALVMRQELFVPFRKRIGAAAQGRVLEIGIGSGLNLPFYGPAVREVTGVDPSPVLLRLAGDRAAGLKLALAVRQGPAETLPFDDGSFNTVVTTWSLCTIGDPVAALREVRRVLAPGGRLLFAEHGLSPDASVARWQNRITPVWKHIAGGCHANRPIDRLIEAAGLRIDGLRTCYADGPRPMAFMFEGAAMAA